MSSQSFRAGAALKEITPTSSQFLYGYPFVERMSTGVHDPLYCQALYLANDDAEVMFIANDLIWVTQAMTQTVRQRIASQTGMPAEHVMMSASHTHSGPIVADMIVAGNDAVVPKKLDEAYLQMLEQRMVEAARDAHARAVTAKIGLGRADATGIGTNRHNPAGPSMLDTPILAIKDANTDKLCAVMVSCAMHPTVMHEDSTLISADFPGMARRYLAGKLGRDVVFVYHMGPAGNQSPRHIARHNTFEEAKRLGRILGRAIEQTLRTITYIDTATIGVAVAYVDLPLRKIPSIAHAKVARTQAVNRLEHLRRSGAPRTQVRTAECDWFGAEETVTLAQAAESGCIAQVASELSPAEVQLIRIGDWNFVGWPGEIFVEYGLMTCDVDPNAFIITLAGSELQGYLVTQEALDKAWYEANNAIFKSPDSPLRFVEATRQLLLSS